MTDKKCIVAKIKNPESQNYPFVFVYVLYLSAVDKWLKYYVDNVVFFRKISH